MKALVALAALAASLAHAQPNIEAGKAKVASVCAACHGMNGVSVSDTIPNLAAQRAAYLEAQLKAFKDGLRRPAGAVSPTATMAAIAAQLSVEDIVNVAAYFAAQPGANQVAQKSSFLPNLAKTHVTFPDDYKKSFVKYHTINFPATRQVRYYYANKAAVDAAKAQGVVGEQADGFLGFVNAGAASAEVRAAVAEINAGRRQLYAQAASQNGVSPAAAGASAFRTVVQARLRPGDFYQDASGAWVRK